MLLITVACGNSENNAPKFDYERWQNDSFGCKGERLLLVNRLKTVKDSLKGFDTHFFTEYLGKPDIQEPYKRSQLYFIYYLDGSKNCESSTDTLSSKLVQVRFNATGLADEVIIMD